MDVFISYSSVDERLAKSIGHALEKAGISVWIATRNIDAGDDFPEKILDGISGCRCMVVIASKYSNASGHVENEIANAVKRNQITIIPYKIDSEHEAITHYLGLSQWIDATADPYGKFDELIAAVCRVLGRSQPPAPSHSVDRPFGIKLIKRAPGKWIFFLFMLEMLLLSLYFAMNVSVYFFALVAFVLFISAGYPLFQKSRCAFAGCGRRCAPPLTKVFFRKRNVEKTLCLCSEHKYTYDLYADKKTSMVPYALNVLLIAVLMCFAAVRFGITPAALVTVSDGFSHTRADFATAQTLGDAIAALQENTACILDDGTAYVYDGYAGREAWGGVRSLSASSTHIVAVRFDGEVLAAGDNSAGQCDTAGFNSAAVKSAEAGDGFTVVLMQDGRVTGAGNNDEGQIDLGGLDCVTQISAGSAHTLALKSDGTVRASGNNDYAQCEVSGWTDMIQVSAGKNISAGLRRDGTVATMAGSVDWTGIVCVRAGDSLVAGLTQDGKVLLAGDENHMIGGVSEWENIIAIDLCGTHIVGLKADHTLVDASLAGTHFVDDGVQNVGTAFNSDASAAYYAKRLAAERRFALTLAGDTLEASGSMPPFEFVGFDDLVQIKANSNLVAGLKTDGTVVVSRTGSGLDIAGWDDLVMLDVSRNHAVGLKNDHTLIAAGDNTYGQSDVGDFHDIVYVSVADTHTVAVREDGSMAAAGDNSDGQCDVQNFTGIKMADTGAHHTVAVRYDGTVAAVGRNDRGQCDVADWAGIVSAAAGDIDIGEARRDIVAVDAVGSAFFLLAADGTLYDVYEP